MFVKFRPNEVEKACIRKLAELFRKGELVWDGYSNVESEGVTDENRIAIINMLRRYEFIKDSGTSGGFGGARLYLITADAEQAAREFDEWDKKEKERKDVLENLKYTMKRHPVYGWLFVIIAVIGGTSFIIHNVVSALKDLGIVKN